MTAAAQPRRAGAAVDQQALVARAREGDHDAFAVLAARAVPRLDKVARLIVRDPDLARDAVQDSLVAAWRDLRGLRDLDRFDAWLHRLTVRACLVHAERNRRRSIEVDIEPISLPSTADVETAVADRELVDMLLRKLTPDRRALVVLHLYVGLPLPDVADALGIPLGTAKSRLHRALSTLRVTPGNGEATSSPATQGRPA